MSMFKELNALLRQGKKHLTLVIAPADKDRLIITLKPTPEKDEAAVLNHPLQIVGTVEELEAGFAKKIATYHEITMEAGDNLKEIEAATKAEADKKAKAKASKPKTTPAKKTAAKKAAKKKAAPDPKPEPKKAEANAEDEDEDDVSALIQKKLAEAENQTELSLT